MLFHSSVYGAVGRSGSSEAVTYRALRADCPVHGVVSTSDATHSSAATAPSTPLTQDPRDALSPTHTSSLSTRAAEPPTGTQEQSHHTRIQPVRLSNSMVPRQTLKRKHHDSYFSNDVKTVILPLPYDIMGGAAYYVDDTFKESPYCNPKGVEVCEMCCVFSCVIFQLCVCML